MPISIDEFREPKLTRLLDRWPMSYNKKDRFIDFTSDTRRYRGEEGFKQPGYNPNHNSTKIEKVKLDVDDIALKPR